MPEHTGFSIGSLKNKFMINMNIFIQLSNRKHPLKQWELKEESSLVSRAQHQSIAARRISKIGGYKLKTSDNAAEDVAVSSLLNCGLESSQWGNCQTILAAINNISGLADWIRDLDAWAVAPVGGWHSFALFFFFFFCQIARWLAGAKGKKTMAWSTLRLIPFGRLYLARWECKSR